MQLKEDYFELLVNKCVLTYLDFL